MRRFRPILLVFLFVFVILSGPSQVYAANSVLGKTGRDMSTNSTSQIRAGNNNKWVISYDNTSGSPASALINDTIPTGSQYSGSSVQTPPGWGATFSTNNGGSYNGVDAGSATTNLRFSNPVVGESANGSSQISNQPLTSASLASSGEDEYMPIPYNDKIYGLVHHSSNAGHEIVCSNATGANCSGYPAALNLSGQTDFYTSINPLSYVDQVNGRLFFTVQRSVGYGIACWEMVAAQFCPGNGYTQLSATGNVLGADQPSNILGVVQTGGCLYAWDDNFMAYSFNPVTFATSCGGFGNRSLAASYGLTAYTPGNHNLLSSVYGMVASAQVIGGKIYFPINYTLGADVNFLCGFLGGIFNTNYCDYDRLVCFDPSTSNGVCAGWATPVIGGPQSPLTLMTGVFTDINNGNNPCVMYIDATPGVFSTTPLCYNATTGANASVPPGLALNVINDARAMSAEAPVFLMGGYEEATTTTTQGHQITVFPFQKSRTLGNAITGAAGCYDWTTSSECAGWGSNGDGETIWSAWSGSADVNGGDTRDYGYAVDDRGCLLGMGDAGLLWSFTADDGKVPCRRTTASVTINPAAFYCDGTGDVTGWDKVKISSINLADFQNIYVSINDNSDTPIGGYQNVDIVSTSGQLDISGIPYSGNTQNISVKILFVALNGNPWVGGNSPIASVSFSGDDAQICYQTIAQDICNVNNIVNTANSVTTQLSDNSLSNLSASHSMGLVLSSGKVCGVQTTNVNGDNGALAQTGKSPPGWLIIGLLVSSLGASWITPRLYRRRSRVNYRL